jgi:DNA-directed RNA polymerase II subunit RPB3
MKPDNKKFWFTYQSLIWMEPTFHILEDDSDQGRLTFTLTGSDLRTANDIRRFLVSDVPTLAIEIVEFHTNSSQLYDEVIASRLGLVPLWSGSIVKDVQENVEVTLKLSVSTNKRERRMVTSNDIEVISRPSDSDPRLGDPVIKVPIVELVNGAKLEMTMIAKFGVAATHAKWSPLNVRFSYRPGNRVVYSYEIETNGALTSRSILDYVSEQFSIPIRDHPSSM